MKIYFDANEKIDLRENYELFEIKVLELLKKVTDDEIEIRRVKNAISEGTKLQDSENHILEIEVTYIEVLHNITIIWTFPISEETDNLIEYIELSNHILRYEGLEKIKEFRKEFLKEEIKLFHEKYPNRLDGFRTSTTPLLLCCIMENPIHITKGNTKIDFKQYYTLKNKV